MSRNLINNFLYGETSQQMAGRLDSEAYAQGCHSLENMIVLKQGGIRRRAPLKHLIDANGMGAKWLIPFTLSSEKSFVVIMSNTGMYFARWKKEDASEELTMYNDLVDTNTYLFLPYSNAFKEQFVADVETSENLYINEVTQETINNIEDEEFKEIKYAQYYNSLYIVHRNHPMMRVDYNEIEDTFSLTLPRIIVNQDVDYRLKKAELDKGYTISKTLGWDVFSEVKLNTPQNSDGKKNYPSVIAIIGERMWLGNTEANPDIVWVSRPYGSSQVLDKNENRSIQDFTQFEIVEEDIQELKPEYEFPMKVMTDDNGMPVLKKDANLNPLFRIPRGLEFTSSYFTDEGATVEGFVIDKQLFAIKTDDVDENGFPIYVNMSGKTLFNRVETWQPEKDSVDTYSYVEGLYENKDFSECFLRAKLDSNNKPVTTEDREDNYDTQLNGNQVFLSYTVPLYTKYEGSGTHLEPESYWFNSDKINFNYKGHIWNTRYVYTNFTTFPEGSRYAGFTKYFPNHNEDGESPADSLSFSSEDSEDVTFTGWKKGNSFYEESPVKPTSESRPTVNVEEGTSYSTYSQSIQVGEVVVKQITKKYVGSWVKDAEGFKRKHLTQSGFQDRMYDTKSKLDNIQHPHEGQDAYVLVKNYFLGIDGLAADTYTKYSFKGHWEIISTIEYGTMPRNEMPISDVEPTGTNAVKDMEIKIYEPTNVGPERFGYYRTIWTYATDTVETSAVPSDLFDSIADEAQYTGGDVVVGTNTYDASVSPIKFSKTGNICTFYYSGTDILSFAFTEKETNDGNKRIWKASSPEFTVNLTNGVYDILYPSFKDSDIYGYTLGQDELFLEGNAYEEADLSDVNALVKFSKGLTKTSTSTTALELQLASGRSDEIKWIGIQNSILVGTTNGEWTIPARITALDGSASKYSNYGSDIGFFVDINTDSIYLQKNNKARVMYTDYYGTHNTDITFTNQEILDGKIIDIVAKHAPEPMVFFLKDDGKLVALCYDRDNKIQGWSRLSFNEQKIQSIAEVENQRTQTILALCNQEIADSTYSYICQFNEDFEDDEEEIYKDCGFGFVQTNEEFPISGQKYYIRENNEYRATTEDDFTIQTVPLPEDAEKEDMKSYKVFVSGSPVSVMYRESVDKFFFEDDSEAVGFNFPEDFYDYFTAFKQNVDYYVVRFDNYSIDYVSRMTTNAYDAQTQDGSVTIGMPKKVDKVIFRALNTGRIRAYTTEKNTNTSIYTVSEDKRGLGDFSMNINGGTTRDLMLTVESVGGDPMTLLALAYDVRVNYGNQY